MGHFYENSMKPLDQIDQELRSAIVEAVPEIEQRIVYAPSGDIQRMDIFPGKNIKFHNAEELFRDTIQLHDVLRAGKGKLDKIFIDRDGCFCMTLPGWRGYEAIEWNLSQDLSGQSEETKRFLHSVICKPKQ
jgi:hypothetical protein